MHSLNYSVYIFDCDGVILDSNQLKINAMRMVLTDLISDKNSIEKCTSYFKNNFGKSRFHHVEYFIAEIIPIAQSDKSLFKEKLLSGYSSKCKELYLKADVTPGFEEFISTLSGKKYVASGSEQQELREVFEKRDLSQFFDQIYGSPTLKNEIIRSILTFEQSHKAIVFGDSHADYNAAKSNDIDFIGYLKYSNVEQEMRMLAREEGFAVIEDWEACR